MRAHLIAVSIGNTSVQVGLTSESSWPPNWSGRLDMSTGTCRPEQLAKLLPADPVCWYVSSVHRASEFKLAAWVRQTRRADHYQLLTHDQLPLQIHVDQAWAVGMDRLVAAVAVNRLRSNDRPSVVVDAGTAITVDLLSADGAFLGGSIFPGIEMASRALANDTDLLPQVAIDFAEKPSVVGKSTESAILSGLLWGAVGAIRELVTRMSIEIGQPPQLFVTGGDAKQLAAHLGSEYQFVPELVLNGIVAATAQK